FSSIFVSTDCDKIESLAKEEEAFVHRRADYTATDEASSVLAVQEFLQYHNDIENICLVQCTSPFLKESYLKEGFALFTNNSEWDSVFSVTRRRILRWSEDLPSKPLNFDIRNRPRRQTFSGDLCENGMFYFAKRSFIDEGLLQGGRCCFVEISEEDSFDIDSPLDLFLAQQLINCYRNEKK
ncbi:N-acylneuraminate cytidylyltransferase, partial [Armadillidium nasatum]